jgi:hypothetical protein
VIGIALLAMAIWFGIFPQSLLNYMDKSVDKQTARLTEWTKDVKEAPTTPQPATSAELPTAEPDRVSLLNR